MTMTRRTILYYPTIEIPDGPWLRQALLYFDDLGSIFPTMLNWDWEDLGEATPLPEHMKMLEGEGEYRRFAPEYLVRSADDDAGEEWPVVHGLNDELRGIVKSSVFARRLPPLERRRYVHVHVGKLTSTVLDVLQDEGLAGLPERDDHHQWHRVESTVADLYLGMLAAALAEKENARTFKRLANSGAQDAITVVTGTDRLDAEALVWKANEPGGGHAVFEARWLGVLPTPGPEVTLEKIVKFKRQHRDELLHFRVEMDNLVEGLSQGESRSHAAVSWREKMERELSTLARLMGESRWQVVWGSLKAMLDLKQLGALNALAAVGVASAQIPLAVAVGGMAIAGSIEIASEFIERGRRKREALDGSPFSYLMSARGDGVFD
jgi:hypothetical protein